MVYELRPYKTVDDWTEENGLGVIVWETDEITDESNLRICGKLVSFLGFETQEEFRVPDGIESIGYSAFIKGEWEAWDCPFKKVIIPASVKKIEEGAFVDTWIAEFDIHPESKCAKVMNNGLYTYNGDTLLWIIDANDEEDSTSVWVTEDDSEDEDNDDIYFEYTVPDGVKRIGVGCIPQDGIEMLTLPESVTEIGWDEYGLKGLIIKAPANSYAIKFAKEHDIEYVEI